MDRHSDKALRRFRKLKVARLEQLMTWMECSRRTVQRRLQQWKCISSYNHNGGFYVLPEIPSFNAFGIWMHGDVYFSRHGTLAATVLALIEQSSAGLTAPELEDILMLKPYSFMSRFAEQLAIQRRRFKGRYVFLAGDRQRGQEQLRKRQQAATVKPTLPESEAIEVLVGLLKHPTDNCRQLSGRVIARAPHASPEAIEDLLHFHHILPRKKNTRSNSK
jgi:hypothetical protein